MTAVEALLQPIADEAPSGEDLEYDPEYLAMEQAAEGSPEQEMGDSRIAAVEPDWRDLHAKATAVLQRTHDLRAAQRWLGSGIRTQGVSGLKEGLALVNGYLETYWDTVFPRIDPDDGDATMRVNTLLDLCDPRLVLDGIRTAALVEVRGIGRFSLRDLRLADGTLTATTGAAVAEQEQEVPSLATINAAFMETDLQALSETHTTLSESASLLQSIDTRVREQVGTEHSADFGPLNEIISDALAAVAEPLSNRGGVSDGDDSDASTGGGDVGEGRPMATVPGVIASRADAAQALTRICEYYRRHEPSSPVPILLERARRLMDKDFMDVIRDLAPDGLTQMEAIRGPADEESE